MPGFKLARADNAKEVVQIGISVLKVFFAQTKLLGSTSCAASLCKLVIEAAQHIGGGDAGQLRAEAQTHLGVMQESSSLERMSVLVATPITDKVDLDKFVACYKAVRNVTMATAFCVELRNVRAGIFRWMAEAACKSLQRLETLDTAVEVLRLMASDPQLTSVGDSGASDKEDAEKVIKYSRAAAALTASFAHSSLVQAQNAGEEAEIAAFLAFVGCAAEFKKLEAVPSPETDAEVATSAILNKVALLWEDVYARTLRKQGVEVMMRIRRRLSMRLDRLEAMSGGMTENKIWTDNLAAVVDDEPRLFAHYEKTVGCMDGPQIEQWLEECLQDRYIFAFAHWLYDI